MMHLLKLSSKIWSWTTYRLCKCCAPQTPLVVRSGLQKKRHNNNHLLRNPPSWRRLDSAGETTKSTRTTTNREKQSTYKFNEIQPTCPRPRGKGEILLIQQSITNYSFFKEFSMEIFSGIPYMRALAPIYSHRVSGV